MISHLEQLFIRIAELASANTHLQMIKPKSLKTDTMENEAELSTIIADDNQDVFK